MQDTSRRSQLRELTREVHASLDARIGCFHNVDDYGRYALGLFRFRLPLERAFQHFEWPEAFGGWRPRAIGALLTRDLSDLGLRPPSLPDAALPLGTGELMGVLYVLEGSSLGSQVLWGRARELGLSADFAASHLADGRAALANWKAFRELLERLDPAECAGAATGALGTFGQAEYAMSSVRHA